MGYLLSLAQYLFWFLPLAYILLKILPTTYEEDAPKILTTLIRTMSIFLSQ